MALSPIPCVVYAAKSTEDTRGSITTQIEDAHAEIKAAGGRVIAGEYRDEAASAYTGNRGAGLDKAMRHAADLARLGSGAELWVQHSDRLARGDGKTARHVVEVALWASKTDVTIRSIQDPETFRDLLYAVVTGQRNHMDSERKGASVSAGLRRAVARGTYAGICVDGYRLVVKVGPSNTVIKCLEIDPERAPLIRMIFQMAEAGYTPRQTAKAIRDAGWTTARGHRTGRQIRYEDWEVLRVLKNPRYAGLSPWKGKILAEADWPRYIIPERFAALRAQRVRKSRPNLGAGRPKHPFLLVGIARCGLCHAPIRAITGDSREDGTRRRSYVCSAHVHQHCAARPIDAVCVDSMLVRHLDLVLADPPYVAPAEKVPHLQQLKRQIADALARDDLPTATSLLDELRTHADPGQRTAAHDPTCQWLLHPAGQTLRTSLLDGFHSWATAALADPESIPVAETERLRKILAQWFEWVSLLGSDSGFEMTPAPRWPARRGTISVDYGAWRLSTAVAGHPRRRRTAWTADEMIHAIHCWVDEHGRPPRYKDWTCATPSHPVASGVSRTFGRWATGLEAAGYDKPRRLGRST